MFLKRSPAQHKNFPDPQPQPLQTPPNYYYNQAMNPQAQSQVQNQSAQNQIQNLTPPNPKKSKWITIGLSALSAIALLIAGFMGYLFLTTNKALTSAKVNIDTLATAKAQTLLQPAKDKLQADFTEQQKLPYRSYTSPSQFGSVKLQFPKYWSSYVVGTGTSDSIDFYAYPYDVPSQTNSVRYALRMRIQNGQFSEFTSRYDDLVKQGKVQTSVIENTGVKGLRIKGLITDQIDGTMIAFPVRDKVVTIWTEGKDYQTDFEAAVVSGLTFIP